ncbi:hypothetical protein EVAR_8870_1 [Eumeta japonica]|uniref:Uncharacterized protein n=1 Tax=Eumeta variegata TaxID=151549 RepID=A0A4C1U0F5_EUMVA|nr:hypothetical protein EVAR_8870_1 [Eumeta japonica]
MRFVVKRQIRGSAVGCMLHVNACCRQASPHRELKSVAIDITNLKDISLLRQAPLFTGTAWFGVIFACRASTFAPDKFPNEPTETENSL